MTNINLLPIVTVQAVTSQDGDIALSVGIQKADQTPLDLTGIGFSLQWRKQAGDTSVLFEPGLEGYLPDGDASGIVAINAPQSRAARIPAGSYVADLVATADGKTLVVGTWNITHAAMGICRVALVGSLQRNAATAGIVGYVPGPPGKSAYQVALDDGFVGTQSAWLASLVGDVTPAAIAARDAAAASASGAAASKTAADADAAAAGASATAAANSATGAANSKSGADASAATAAQNAAQTGNDRTQTGNNLQATTTLLASFRSVFLGAFQNDAAADAFAVANSVTKSAGISYENTTTAKVRVWSGTAWADQDADAQTQSTNAGLSAAAAAGSATAAASSATGAAASKTTSDTNAAATAADRTAVHTDRQAADTSAAAAATTKQLIDAAIASFNAMGALPALPYLLDGLPPAALFSAPKGAFALNGSYVSLSSLLTFSTAQKYTVGPDGNYILNAANAPAWDWSTGRKRLLIEAIASTNVLAYSNDYSNAAWRNQSTVTKNVADPFGGTTAQTITTGGNLFLYQGVSIGSGVTPCVASVWLRRRSGTGYVNFYKPDTSLGTNLALTSSWKRFSFAGNSFSNGVGYLELVFGTAGDQIDIWNSQLEVGTALSSDIVTGASATTRAADVVTAASGLLALLNSGTASLAVRGSILAGGGVYPSEPGIIGGVGDYASVFASSFTSNQIGGLYFQSALNSTFATIANGQSPATNSFGVGAAYTPALVKGSLNGGAVSSGSGAAGFNSSETNIRLGAGYNNNALSNLLLDELVVWPFVGSDAGIQAQARAYQ